MEVRYLDPPRQGMAVHLIILERARPANCLDFRARNGKAKSCVAAAVWHGRAPSPSLRQPAQGGSGIAMRMIQAMTLTPGTAFHHGVQNLVGIQQLQAI